MNKRKNCPLRHKTNGTDYEMPILRGEDRKYVDDEVYLVEEE